MPDYTKPFPVRIISDASGGLDNLSGEFGMCMGAYDPFTYRADPNGIPLIRTESGCHRWGSECYWTEADWAAKEPLERLQQATAAYAARMRERFADRD